MNTAAARHTGLPFVPQPAPDELLGSWLRGGAPVASRSSGDGTTLAR
jgi:hypothetical protein